jgi:hypothetical protein
MAEGSSLLPVVMLLLASAVWGWGLADVLRTDERDVRAYPKQTWLLIVAFGSVIGAVYWFAAGRPAAPPR